MAITVADNFSYQGKKPLDGRDTFTTLAAMKAYAEASVYDGCLSYCDEDGKRYEFKSTNTVDPTTGKWREFSAGGTGGGHTIQDDGVDMTARDNLNFVGFNVTDDSANNRTTVTFPNIDLSVLSNEAFQFSPIEKPVGTWTDSNNVTKLVYARTFFGSGTLTLPKLVFTNVSTYFGIDVSNIAKIVNSILLNNGGTSHLVPLHCDIYQSALQLYYDGVVQDTLSDGILTLFYTKTTDSPLASDVKFAGVDENGNVIYKKTFTGTWNSTTTAETKTFAFASTLKLRKIEGVYHTQYGDWNINALNYNVSNNRLDYGVVARTDPSNNTLVVERNGAYLSPLSGRSFEVDVYYTLAS